MNINLIETLLNEPPEIDRVDCTIKSSVSLSDVVTDFDEKEDEKSYYVEFSKYIDQSNNPSRNSEYGMIWGGAIQRDSIRYENMWKDFNLEPFIISKKLLDFFINKSGISYLQAIFSMSTTITSDKRICMDVYFTLVDKFNNLREGKDGYLIYGKKNLQVRYGKFVNMLIGIIFNGSGKIPGVGIETSVDIYKSEFSTSKYNISVLKGKDILLGYNRDYHARKYDSMLSNSCMNGKYKEIKLYTVNPKKIFLFVITDENGKILSRNLVWKLKKYNNFIFDRVYAVDNHIRRTAENLAKSENWILYEEGIGVRDIKKISENGDVRTLIGKKLKIRLSFRGVRKYPYCDTFKYQSIFSRRLCNKMILSPNYHYTSTYGDRTFYVGG